MASDTEGSDLREPCCYLARVLVCVLGQAMVQCAWCPCGAAYSLWELQAAHGMRGRRINVQVGNCQIKSLQMENLQIEDFHMEKFNIENLQIEQFQV